MKIGIDGLPFRSNPSGIGKYVLSLLYLLLERFPEAQFYIYSNGEIVVPNDIKTRVIMREDQSLGRKMKPIVWLKLKAGKMIEKDNINFYFSGTGFLPHLQSSVKTALVVHDLNYKIAPKTMGFFHYISHLLFLKHDTQKSDFVICNSHGTKNKVNLYFQKKTNIVINPPIESHFGLYEREAVVNVLKKYNINFPYLLTVGTLEPRKNLSFTLDSFVNLLNQNKLGEHRLVIVGSKGWQNKEVIRLCQLYSQNIIRLGYVPDEDLPYIYNGATTFLFPSIYEGFGIPVREAIYCGTPVITSDIEELRESGGQYAQYIDPTNKDQYEKEILESIHSDFHKKNLPLPIESENIDELYRFFESGNQLQSTIKKNHT
ncbi:MAG: glycosyltransferase family 1 protein [Bacteroidales bacterium]|nr:glycosyltransferase family 1 protein [Bacteroidales bacterium]